MSTFEEQFPSLKGKIATRDGIASCMTFQIKNITDLDEAKKILNEQFIALDLIKEICLDKQKVKEAMNFKDEDFWEEIANSNYNYNEVIEAYKERLSKELNL